MTGENTELARQLGELQGKVAALQREMTAHRLESREGTERLHKRVSDGLAALTVRFDEHAAAIRDLEARWVGEAAVSKFKRTIGYALLTLSGGAGAEFIRHLRDWYSGQ